VQLDDLIIFLIIAGSIVTSIIRSINEQNKKKPPAQGQRPSQPVGRGQTPEPSQSLQGDLQKRLEEARRRVQQAMESQTGRGSEGEIGRAPAPPPLISGGLEGTSLEGTSLEGQTQRRGTLESSGGLLQEQDYTLKPLVLEKERLERESLKRQELKRERLEDTLIKGERNVFRPIDASNRNPNEFQQQVKPVQPFMTEVSHRGRRSLAETAPAERKRQRTPTTAPKHAKISGSELLSPEMLTEKELLRGFLWQQILSEPRAKTGYKKTQLRTYSMPKAKAKG
jgi:hypothetical protein